MIPIAILGLIVFIILVSVAAWNKEFHIGFASLLAALVFGVFALGLSSEEIISRFPTKLFLTLVSVTLLFAFAETNGTLGIVAERSINLCQGRIRLLPPLIFIFTFLISALGVGNIAATAFMAPTAMVLARRLNLSAFLMTLVVVGGANAASLSPFSLTGVLLFELIVKAAPELGVEAVKTALLRIFLFTFLVIATFHFLGFICCGGIKWWKDSGGLRLKAEDNTRVSRMNSAQKLTLIAILGSAIGMFMGNSSSLINILGAQWHELGSQLIAIALGLIVVLMLTSLFKIEQAVEKVPWSTILLITGVITYIGVLEHGGAIVWASNFIQSNPFFSHTAPTLAFGSAVLSSISSSSGVVLPVFIPMVPDLAAQSVDIIFLFTSVVVSAHLVDCSPFSTLGALCLASANKEKVLGHEKLFTMLLLWGIAMIPCAVILFWTLSQI